MYVYICSHCGFVAFNGQAAVVHHERDCYDRNTGEKRCRQLEAPWRIFGQENPRGTVQYSEQMKLSHFISTKVI